MSSSTRTMKRILLGSQSPRRQHLLREMGISFSLLENLDIVEDYPPHLRQHEIVEFLAQLKFNAYKKFLQRNDLLITADTIVCLGDVVLGKPGDRASAIAMLQKLSGAVHTVYTGVCVGSTDRCVTQFDRTDVSVCSITLSEIETYIDACKPYDKAGSYGIQEWLGYVAVDKIHGSFYNVMGLPTHVIHDLLKEFDV